MLTVLFTLWAREKYGDKLLTASSDMPAMHFHPPCVGVIPFTNPKCSAAGPGERRRQAPNGQPRHHNDTLSPPCTGSWYPQKPSSRPQAREKYGDKLLTASPDMTATHFLKERGNTPSLRAAAMDQWLFGLADFHVRALGFRTSCPQRGLCPGKQEAAEHAPAHG